MLKDAERGRAGCEEALLRKLMPLARAGVVLDPRADSSAAQVAMVDAASLPPRCLAALSALEWKAARAAGWVEERAPGQARWSLSRRGRQALRRLLSQPSHAAAGGGARRTEVGAGSAGVPTVNEAESPLAWLRRRKDRSGAPMIGDVQFEAGERLRADFWFAQLTPRVTTNWSGLASGGSRRRPGPDWGAELSDRVVAARERVGRALSAVGPELAGVLIDVCCHLKGLEAAEKEAGWPQRSGKVVLELALTRLARHYGLDRQHEGVGSGPARIRQWGAEGYRPSIDPQGP